MIKKICFLLELDQRKQKEGGKAIIKDINNLKISTLNIGRR